MLVGEKEASWEGRPTSPPTPRGGGVEAILWDVWADDVEWDISGYPTVDLPTRGSGRDNLRDLFRTYYAGWTSHQAELTELIDAGENVVGVLHEKTGIAESDDFIERDLFNVWTLRDGLIVKWQVFATRDQALEAAGLSE
jgi:ketosteroid isomerase-like protein